MGILSQIGNPLADLRQLQETRFRGTGNCGVSNAGMFIAEGGDYRIRERLAGLYVDGFVDEATADNRQGRPLRDQRFDLVLPITCGLSPSRANEWYGVANCLQNKCGLFIVQEIGIAYFQEPRADGALWPSIFNLCNRIRWDGRTIGRAGLTHQDPQRHDAEDRGCQPDEDSFRHTDTCYAKRPDVEWPFMASAMNEGTVATGWSPFPFRLFGPWPPI